MALKILHGWRHEFNDRANKILVAAKYAGVNVEWVDSFTFGGSNTTPEFLNNGHPLGRVPVLETEDGYIFESGAILRYVARLDKANSHIYGRTTYEAAQCDQWIDYETSEINPPRLAILLQQLGFAPKDEALAKEAEARLVEAFQGLDNWLQIRTFLVGERLTIADIAVALSVNTVCKMKPAPFQGFANLHRWVNTCVNQANFVEVLKWAAAGKAKEEPKKKEEAKPKEAKKEEAKPKEAKKEDKPKKKDDDEDDDGAEFADEPKKKNPLDLLPPSTFVLDQFKREYSNNDTRGHAAPWFFNNYDPAGYTAFWCKYKYNDELKMAFMTGNLIRGWFQRMDRMHKYAFGCVHILGEESKHEIVGFWVFRGKGLPEVMLEVDDTEHYEWTEIPDVKAEAARITDFMAWDGESFAKSPLLEGRVFK